MKRFLSITLVVCMLLASLTFMTFADTVPANAKFRTGEEGSYVYHEDLLSALAALHGVGGTITQIADYTHSANIHGNNTSSYGNTTVTASNIAIRYADANKGTKPVTIKGDQKYNLIINASTTGQDVFTDFTENLTFENLHIVMNGGFRPWAHVTVTFKDCTVDACATISGSTVTPSGKNWGFCFDGNSTLVFDNTIYNFYGNDRVMGVNGNTTRTASLILKNGSQIVFPSSAKSIQVLELYQSGQNHTVTLKMDATSKIIANTETVSGDPSIMFELQQATNKLIFDLAEGAEIQMNTAGDFIGSSNKGTFSGTLSGLKISADALVAGVNLPKLTNANTLGWKIGEKLYGNGATATDANATADAVATPVIYDVTTGLSMASGASVLVNNPTGIRYTATVSDELRAALAGATVTYGAIIAPNAKVTAAAAFTKEDLGEGNYVDTATKFKWAVENKEYRVVLTNIKDTSMEFTAIPYVTVTYADGSVATIYGAKGDVRSISGVAASALDAAAITADEYNTIMGN